MASIHRALNIGFALLATALAVLPASSAVAQTAPAASSEATPSAPELPLQISWEVRNRFRLFREERDFLLHSQSGAGSSVLATEQSL